MATGESFRSLAFAFRISQSYITRIVRLVLESLSNRLTPILLPTPTKEDMVEISKDFWKKWNFPNCVGAIDGKHIRIFSPKNSGTLFFNYKDFFSIVLLAIVDANCKFVFVDIGSYGKEGDSGIFTKSKISEKIKNGDFFPPNAKIPNSDKILPYIIVGDGAFRLDPHMIRPYSKIESRNDCEKKIFNYRLSRARRTTENSFGLLSQVFRVFYTPIPLKIQTVDKLVLSACCLHNLLRNQYTYENMSEQHYYNFDSNDSPANNMIQLEHTGGYGNYEGFMVRDELKKFFNSPQGAIPWQNYQTLNTDT